MKTVFKPAAMIAVVLATPLVVSCARERNEAGRSSSAAVQKEAPAAIRYDDYIWAGGVPPPAGELSKAQIAPVQSAKDGEALFNSMNCDGCHGGGAVGSVGPSLSDGRWRYGGEDEEVFSSIFYGRPKGMPAFGGLLGQGGVWLLVAYIKSLPKPDSVPTLSEPNPPTGEGRPSQDRPTGASTQ